MQRIIHASLKSFPRPGHTLWFSMLIISAAAFVSCPRAVADEKGADVTAPAVATNASDAAHAPMFTAVGLVSINARDAANLEIEQQTQARLLTHGGLLSHVLEASDPIHQTEWYKKFSTLRDGKQQVDLAAAKADLIRNFHVSVIPKSRLLEVRMSAPVAKDCQTIVREIVDQHIKDQKALTTAAGIQDNQALENMKVGYEAEIRSRRSRMLRIATNLGQEGVSVDITSPNGKEFELQSLVTAELRASSVAGAAAAKLKTFDQQMETNSAPELEEALQKSAVYKEYRHDVDELELAYADLVSTAGPQQPQSLKLKQRLDQMEKKLTDTENEIRSKTAELLRANLTNDQEAASAASKRIGQRLIDVRNALATLATDQNEYRTLEGELKSYVRLHNRVQEQQDQIGFLMNNEKSSPVDWAAVPDLPVVAEPEKNAAGR